MHNSFPGKDGGENNTRPGKQVHGETTSSTKARVRINGISLAGAWWWWGRLLLPREGQEADGVAQGHVGGLDRARHGEEGGGATGKWERRGWGFTCQGDIATQHCHLSLPPGIATCQGTLGPRAVVGPEEHHEVGLHLLNQSIIHSFI